MKQACPKAKSRPLMFMVRLRTGWHQINLLPMLPIGTFESMEVRIVDGLGLCRQCPAGSICHVLWNIPGTKAYEKLCPILFIDYVRPGFELKDIA